ncbi:hypothetical protein BC936DRAFT_143015 [Jimgerdemannia flammicorona]|uniref:Uncharacterized protein n=1 Tax=Jimgerdemannia flammicorona TaxID=994334 RepID=A0A432ZZY4_9FUNG|nr:hypothetical protein BC936DRAFT_143015 [Jimgerdemannia flammicorona]
MTSTIRIHSSSDICWIQTKRTSVRETESKHTSAEAKGTSVTVTEAKRTSERATEAKRLCLQLKRKPSTRQWLQLKRASTQDQAETVESRWRPSLQMTTMIYVYTLLREIHTTAMNNGSTDYTLRSTYACAIGIILWRFFFFGLLLIISEIASLPKKRCHTENMNSYLV